MSTHKDDVEMMRKSFREAASDVRGALSMPNDMDLERYKKMTTTDFGDMTKKLGADSVVDYIKDMEMRLNGVRRHGKKD